MNVDDGVPSLISINVRGVSHIEVLEEITHGERLARSCVMAVPVLLAICRFAVSFLHCLNGPTFNFRLQRALLWYHWTLRLTSTFVPRRRSQVYRNLQTSGLAASCYSGQPTCDWYLCGESIATTSTGAIGPASDRFLKFAKCHKGRRSFLVL